MKLLILNGPNLNLLGSREKQVYGSQSFDSYLEELEKNYPDIHFDHYQSNVEGELINTLQKADGNYKGVIFNAGGYTHTSVAIADAIAAIEVPVVEVHISNVYAREEFRKTSLIAPVCSGTISGFGMNSYRMAVESFRH